MRLIYANRAFLFFALFQSVLFSASAQKQSEYWKDLSQKIILNSEQRSSMPSQYRSLELDLGVLNSQLSSAIDENDANAFVNGPVISLPLPDGTFSDFRVAVSSLLPKQLHNNFPMIQAYTAVGVDDPSSYAKLDVTQHGFHAMIISSRGWFFIDPAFIGNTSVYISYDRRFSQATSTFICETENELIRDGQRITPDYSVERSAGTQLKTYRLAVACTGEYASFFGGTVAAALSAIVTSVNRVNGVYELELSVRLVLIANNNLIVYTNAGTDPYTNGDGGTMLGENQSNLTSVIGSSNYDIGHVFGIGSGGIAGLGVVCSSGSKANGVTGNASPVGDNFDIDYVAHEMGHQFGGNHTFNSVTGNCNGNRSSSAAYEVGSGTTIMAYAGICDADDIQPHSDAIFHSKSFDEMQTYITSSTGSTCPVVTATGNTPPVVTVSPNYTIPLNTPFILTGSATDVNNDALTYLWEEYDLGPAGAPNSPSGNAPIFRDFVPTINPFRVFPRMEDLVRNQQTLGEILPTYARSLAFRLVVRDNRAAGGGVTHNDTPVTLTVSNTTTPFRVTIPNTAVTWFANSSQTITWDVSSTNIAPISCANVNILLSVDSGYTYPYTLLANTPNDGSQVVTLPSVISNKARVKVESVGNIFFDISNVNFTISASSPVLTLLTTQSLVSNSICAGSTIDVTYAVDGPANAGNIFTAQLSNASGNFSSPTNIGTLSSVNAGTIAATIPSGTANGTGYRIRVVSSNPVVTGSDNGANITINQSPATPGTITGSATVCQGQSGVVYTVPAIANATGYAWNFTSGVTINSGTNTNSVTVTFSSGAVTGTVTVYGTNATCPNGPVSTPKSIVVNPLPSAPGIISGASAVCQGQQSVAYSVPSISNATGYIWSLPSGATIAGGNNTNSITVNFAANASSGNISVAGSNSCGNGTSSSLAVTVNPAPAAPVITANGPVSICTPGSVVLSFTPVAGVSYQWRKNSVNIAGQTSSNYTATTAGNYDVVATFASIPAQTFTNSSVVSIPDNTCPGGTSSIAVSGYNGTVASSGISIKINITHPYVGDLVLFLSTVDSKLLGLSNRTGNSSNNGDNFTNTVFSDAGSGVLPTSGAPYTGIYKPVAATFTNCQTSTITTFAAIGSGSINPNGTWTFRATDMAGQDVGSIQNWSISFPVSTPNTCSTASNVIGVTVNNNVTPAVSIVSDQGNDVCAGSNVIFTATPVNGGDTPAYQWKKNGTSVGLNSATFATTSLADGDVITCELTSNAACVTGNPAVSNSITMNVQALPVISSFTPSSGNSGTQVSISGEGFTNASAVNFNGTSSTFTVTNDQLISATVPVNATNGLITVVTPCGSAVSPYNFFVDVGGSVTLDLRVLIEGFYRGNGQMAGVLSPSVCDTIFVGLAEINSPYSILYSSRGTVSITGNGSFLFPGLVQGNSYYIVVRHRNSIEIWSKVPFLFSSQVNVFDFSY